MPKQPAQEIALIDQEGQEWARATLSLTRLNALIKEYKRQGIHLTPKERVSA
jgi:hypothetical protein